MNHNEKVNMKSKLSFRSFKCFLKRCEDDLSQHALQDSPVHTRKIKIEKLNSLFSPLALFFPSSSVFVHCKAEFF